MSFILKNKNFTLLIIISLIFRLILSYLPAFEYDQNSFRFWSIKLAEQGLTNFYSSNFFTSNPVGFFYPLWIIGSFVIHSAPWIANNKEIFDLLLKLPANISDILTGVLIFYLVLKDSNQKWATLGFIAYVFNPAIFFNSSIWGQYDGIPALFLLLTIYFLVINKKPELGFIFYGIAWTFKPQAIAVLPVIGLLTFIKYRPIRWATSAISLLIVTLIIYFPFFPQNPLGGLISVNFGSATLFQCTSCFAFNFWGMFGNWGNDLEKYYKINYLNWGIILFLLSLIPILFFKPFLKKYAAPYFFVTAGLSIFAFFSFLTRMHERYLFPFFVFFLIGALFLKSRILLIFYFLISLLYTVNLYVPYIYYNKQLNIPLIFTRDFTEYTKQFSIISFILFLTLLVYFFKILNRPGLK